MAMMPISDSVGRLLATVVAKYISPTRPLDEGHIVKFGSRHRLKYFLNELHADCNSLQSRIPISSNHFSRKGAPVDRFSLN